MMDFQVIKRAVAKQFATLAKGELFVVDIEKDKLWETYLASFPAGTNPLYKNRTEHDCNCCKQFIRAVGGVVGIVDGKIQSIWDVKVSEPGYQAVANGLSALVYSGKIASPFLHYEKSAGTEKSFQALVEGGAKQWDHFHVVIPDKFFKKADDIASTNGEINSLRQVFNRGLEEITTDALETVLELIDQNSLYRGAENRFVVQQFANLKSLFKNLHTGEREAFTWGRVKTVNRAVCGIRNSAIGTLLTDLSEGVDLERAVASFENKVSGTNYKRPTALVTKAMIEKAKKSISGLGLESALERRYAVLSDITVNNILYANRSAKSAMTGDVFDQLASETASKPKNLDKVEEINIETFLANVLPSAKSLEIMVESNHTNNLVSLIAPKHGSTNPLFKWGNDFSWSYNGEVADSIKERVKAAGGNVTGELCCRLAWEYSDDLDFHMYEAGGSHIYFGNRSITSPNGGRLDVDANGGSGMMEHPVENIFYNTVKTMKNGTYELVVHNFTTKGPKKGAGFEVEIDLKGTLFSFKYDRVLRSGEKIVVAKFVKTAEGISVESVLDSTRSASKGTEVWGVTTNTFLPVNVVMHSPNHWDERAVGNKHYFFMIQDCANEGQARGFYNEFLRGDLEQHRKVMEMVGSKLKTEKAENQLSGLGFSSTMRNSVFVKVNGNFSRIVKIVF